MFRFSIEAMQIWPKNKWRICCSLNLNRSFDRILSIENYCWSSIEAVSVENYEIRFSISDYTYILEYLCRVSFLITLDIYKDYFKSRHKWCKVMQSNNTCILWLEIEIALVHHILYRSYCVFTSLHQAFCNQGASWSSQLMNWRTLQPTIFLKLVC